VATTPTATQTVRAQAKWVRMSARKGRVVAEHIRGRSVPEARAVLAFTPREAARELEKVLASAVANAEANHGLNGDELIVQAAVVDDGPTLKRWRARARGRVARIKKRTCHITLLLAPLAQEGLAVSDAPERPAKSEAEAPEAAETKPKTAASRAAKPKSTTTSESTETASARAKRARKKPQPESEES
jgi:large subunit ribosomal protein L22